MVASARTQSLSDFRQTVTETLDRLNTTGAAEIITVDGEARAVLLSPATYDELASEAGIQSMQRAIRQLGAGEGQDLNVAMDEIRSKLLEMKSVHENDSAK